MKYKDSPEKSAEYLRLAIPLMSRQLAALHPVSYAVWYEYVAGMNLPLQAHIDKLQAAGKLLDEAVTAALYQTYIVQADDVLATRVAEGFQRVLAEISTSAGQAGDQAAQLGTTLTEWSAGVSPDITALLPDTTNLLADTRKMQTAIGSLQTRLDESQKEINKLRDEANQARADALVDALTGLANRRGFDRALAEVLGDEDHTPEDTSVLFVDIDHFKRVNDTYGHLFGDKVLRSVAQVLRSNVKGRDTVARYGGEEFTILLPETNLQGAKVLAEKIRSTIANGRIRRQDNDTLRESVTVSVGVAAWHRGETAEVLLGRADSALYAAKSGGRNRVELAA